MARATLTVQQVSVDGEVMSYATALLADGVAFANRGNERLLVKNGTGVSVTVTIQTPQKVEGDLDVNDREKVVAGGTDVVFGPFATGIYNQSDGTVYVDFSADNAEVVAFRP